MSEKKVGCISLEMNQKCLNKLIETFGEGVHTNDVDKVFVICRDSLISQFKEECMKIGNVRTAINMMHTYCAEGLDLEQKKWNNDLEKQKKIDAKMVCRRFFSELPNLKLCESNTTDKQEVLNNLFNLSVALSYLSQEQYTFYLNGNKGFQIEILRDCFSFTMNDEALIQKNSLLADNLPFDYLKGAVKSIDRIDDFINKTIDVYGEPASELYNVIFHDDNSMLIIDLTFIFKNYRGDEFLQGWVLKKNDDSVLRFYKSPHTAERSRNRPIFKLIIDDEIHYITTPYIFWEAMNEIVFNQLPFAKKPEEWKNEQIISYANGLKNKHDSLLDDEVQMVLENNQYLFLRNKKSIDNIDLIYEKSNVSKRNVGEIDFIIIDTHHGTVYVTDTKFIRTKYDFAAFGADSAKFEQDYNEQLYVKYQWVCEHLQNLQKEINDSIDISDFSVDLFFITNAPSFARFFSKYPIIPVAELKDFLKTQSEKIVVPKTIE